jgi:hypothetical protein
MGRDNAENDSDWQSVFPFYEPQFEKVAPRRRLKVATTVFAD